jgi:hypothetical protein
LKADQSTGLNPFENDSKSGSNRTMTVPIGIIVLGLGLVGFKFLGSTGTTATPTPPQAGTNANVIVPMTAADVQKNLPPVAPIKPPDQGLTKQIKLTPEMIQAQQKAYRERFGRSY